MFSIFKTKSNFSPCSHKAGVFNRWLYSINWSLEKEINNLSGYRLNVFTTFTIFCIPWLRNKSEYRIIKPNCVKIHWCIEQSYRLCWRGRGWEDLGEQHWNMYNIMYVMSCQSRFNAQYWMLGAGALGRPRGMDWGGRREEGSGWGTHVYLWRIHFDIWQN